MISRSELRSTDEPASSTDRRNISTTLPSSKPAIDPIVAVVMVVSLVTYSLHGFEEALDRETSIFAYGGQQALNGVPPYESIFNVIGPLGHILAVPGAALAEWVGFDPVLGMRLVFLLCASLAVGIVYLLSRTLFESRPAAVVTAAAFLSFQPFMHYAVAGPREKTAMVLFVAVALLGAIRRRWAIAGVAASLATLTWQPAFVVGIAITLAALLLSDGRVRAFGSMVLGAMIPVVIVVIYYAVEGSLDWLTDGFLGVGLRAETSSLSPLTDSFAFIASRLGGQSMASVLFFTMGILGMLGTMVWRIVASRSVAELRDDPLLVVVSGFLLSMAWTLYDFQGTPDLFILLPFSAIGVGAVFWLVTRRHQSNSAWLAAGVVAAAAVTLTVLTAVSTKAWKLVEQQRSVDLMLAQLPVDGEVISIGAPQAMVLSGSTNPNPYLTFFLAPATHLEEHWPGGMTGFVEDLAADPPEFIAFRGTETFDDPTGPNAELNQWIDHNYVSRGRAPGWTWLVHRTLAQEVERVDDA